MKKVILITVSLISLASTIFASSQISMSKKFSTKLVPDMLCSSVSVLTEDMKETKVLKRLTKYAEYFSKLDEKYPNTIKGGNYQVTPKYVYEKNKRVFKGYSGYVSYSICKSIYKSEQPAKDIDKIIKSTFKIKSEEKANKNTHINARSNGWKVSPKYYTKAEDELKLQSIIWGEKYSQIISKNINKKCEVKSINISHHSNYVPYRKNMRYSAMAKMETSVSSADIAPSPIKSDEIINLNTSYNYECK
jgi:hypothetical protein